MAAGVDDKQVHRGEYCGTPKPVLEKFVLIQSLPQMVHSIRFINFTIKLFVIKTKELH